MLKIQGISAAYGKAKILQKLSLAVKDSSITAVIGINGSGKTTLLRCVSGLMPITEGQVLFGETNITHLTSSKIVQHGVIHVPENRHIFGQLTVLQNLMVGCYANRHRNNAERDKQLEFVFDLFPVLKKRLKQQAGTLSGGEQQMLAIGRGLMAMPRLLMLDEPSLGLAPLLIRSLVDALKRINKEGITMLLVEQNAHLTVKLADYVYVLENGQVLKEMASTGVESKTLEDLYLGT